MINTASGMPCQLLSTDLQKLAVQEAAKKAPSYRLEELEVTYVPIQLHSQLIVAFAFKNTSHDKHGLKRQTTSTHIKRQFLRFTPES
jgi:hypothetical protein